MESGRHLSSAGLKGCAAGSIIVLWPCAIRQPPSRFTRVERQAVSRGRRTLPVRRDEGPHLEMRDGHGHARRNRPDGDVEQLLFGRSEEGAVKTLMRADDGSLAGPIHADDVHPVRILHKQLGGRGHVVSVPALLVAFHRP